jgi:hypothetical protein
VILAVVPAVTSPTIRLDSIKATLNPYFLRINPVVIPAIPPPIIATSTFTSSLREE